MCLLCVLVHVCALAEAVCVFVRERFFSGTIFHYHCCLFPVRVFHVQCNGKCHVPDLNSKPSHAVTTYMSKVYSFNLSPCFMYMKHNKN